MIRKIYILLPVHNRRDVTERFVECLVAQTYSNYQLVLIDDGSTDSTDQMVRAKINNLTILKGTGDWWWAGSLQHGIDWLERCGPDGQDIAVFANDDITFDAEFLEKAVDILDHHAGGTLLLPQLYDEVTGMPEESGIEADLTRLTFKPAVSPEKINCLSTRGLFMRIADLRRIGCFHPRLLPHYWSDFEFTIRAHRMGFALITSADIAVCLDRQQTGYRDLERCGLIEFVQKTFSKKSVLNPVYYSAFILLAGPMLSAPINIFRVWRDFLGRMARRIRSSLSTYIQRLRLARSIRHFEGDLKVIVGSANTGQHGWISTDYPLLDLTDARTFSALFRPGSVSNFLAEHVWEHLTPEQGAKACGNCLKVLKPGGGLRIAVPDRFHPDADYIAQVKPGGHGAGAEDHKILYDYQMLSALLEDAGYRIKLLEWFDEHGVFHCQDWDIEGGFVRRSTRFDEHNRTSPTAYSSLIVDAIKP